MTVDAVQKTGKTVDEAVSEALKELGIGREDAEIEVLEEGFQSCFKQVVL